MLYKLPSLISLRKIPLEFLDSTFIPSSSKNSLTFFKSLIAVVLETPIACLSFSKLIYPSKSNLIQYISCLSLDERISNFEKNSENFSSLFSRLYILFTFLIGFIPFSCRYSLSTFIFLSIELISKSTYFVISSKWISPCNKTFSRAIALFDIYHPPKILFIYSFS